MKKIFLLAVCAVVSLTMSAQLVTSSRVSVEKEPSTGWGGLRLSYLPAISLDVNVVELDFSGVSLGWVKGVSVSNSLPLFIESGFTATYGFGNLYEEEDYKESIQWLSVQVPVNFGYKYAVNDSFSLFPYVGVTLRGNIMGQVTEEDEYSEEEYDLFSEDDMGDNAFKRFNIGWQIGVGLNYGKLHLGVSYGNDFNEIAEECKVSMTSVTLGVNF